MPQISLYRRGYCMRHARNVCGKSGGGPRGKLIGKDSAASFRRFRKWCITHDIYSDCWGITLTVPGLDLLSVNDFKALHHRLCVWVNDHELPLVWRVELQKRGQPHLHCVLYSDVRSALHLLIEWYKLLDSLEPIYNAEYVSNDEKQLLKISRAYLSGSEHACDLQKLTGDYRSYRYLVAHMSKRKHDQLGWAGRNWGVCNRCLFADVDSLDYDLTDKEFYQVRRWIRRLTRSKAFRGDAFLLGNPDTIRRMLDFVLPVTPF